MNQPERTSAYQAEPEAQQPTPLPSSSTATGGQAGPPVAESLPRAFGRYTLQKLLGKGGMGRVYLAHDPQLDRLVALKMPIPVDAVEGWRERFLTEARAAATLTHPNVCPVYDVGEVDAQPYLTMAFIEGETLAAKLARDGPMSPAKAVRLVETVARAMHEAHRRGIIHRDLKPANLMLDAAGRPVIMDFGLAIRSTNADDLRLTLTGVALGTPAYMPPEQAGGDTDSIGAPADVYALGVILFELVTGRTPFQAKTFGKLLAQIERDPPPPPSSLNPNVDSALEAIILTALAKAPADRFASAAEFADALERHQQGDREGIVSLYSRPFTVPCSTAAFPPGPDSFAAPPIRSRRRGWAMAAVGLLLAGAIIAAGAAVYVETDYGQIVVQLSDPKAKVDVRVNGQEMTLAAEGGKPIRIRAGKHQKLEVAGADFETVAESFDLKRGDVYIARVTLKPKAILAKAQPDPNPVDPPKKTPVDPPKKEVVVKPPEPEPKPKPTPTPFPEKSTLIEAAGWQVLVDASKDEMQTWLNDRQKAKHSVTFLDVYDVSGKPVFCGIAALDDRRPNWSARLDMPALEFNPDGEFLRIFDFKKESIAALSGYPANGKILCAVLWRAPRMQGYVSPDDGPTEAAEKLVRESRARNFPEILRPYSIGAEQPSVAYVTKKELTAEPKSIWKAGAAELDAFLASAREDGLLVKNVCAYTRLGKLEFAAVAWPGQEKSEWQVDTDVAAAEFQAKAAANAEKGLRPESVTAYAWNGAVRYCAVWVKEPTPPVPYPKNPTLVKLPGWQILADADRAQMQKWLDDRKKDKHSLIWLDAHPVSDRPVFSAIAALDDRKTNWVAFLDVKASEFGTGAILKRLDIKKQVMRSAGGYVEKGEVVLALLLYAEPRAWDFIPDCAEEILDPWRQREAKLGLSYHFARPFPYSPTATLWTIYSERNLTEHRINLTPKALADELGKLRKANRRPLALAGAAGTGGVRFTMTSIANMEKLDWLVDGDVPAARLKAIADERSKDGYRPEGISAYAWDGAVRYCVYWLKDGAKAK